MIPQDATFDVLALGDVHCHYDLVARIARQERERAPFQQIWQVGDFSQSSKYRQNEDVEQLRHLPLYRVNGNHEIWDRLETLPGTWVRPGELITTKDAPSVRILGFGGVFTTTYWEERNAHTWKDGRRKAFTKEEYEQARRRKDVDVLITHETGAYLPNFHTKDRGQILIKELVEEVSPAVHLSGHHHHFVVRRHDSTVGFMLPIPTVGWARLHFEHGQLVSYSVARMQENHMVTVAERILVPETNLARSGMPGADDYYETYSEQARRRDPK